MFRVFYPHEYVESVFAIDYEKVYNKGYRGVIFDIDNTLVPHGKDSTNEIDELFRRIHEIGLQTIVLSNNSEERIRRFLANIDSLYIDDAQKPKTGGYRKALQMLGMRKEDVLCVGDQVFTDIYGANRSGIASILVRYIRAEDETKIGIRRTLEKMVLRLYGMCRSCQNRIGDIQVKEAGCDAQETKEAFL